jgi:hypothetical protein
VTTKGNVVTTGAQSYTGPVALGADTIFSTTNAAVSFGGALNGGFKGTIASGSGAVTLTGIVSGLTSLDSTGSGAITINAASVTTTGTQSYVGAITLFNAAPIALVAASLAEARAVMVEGESGLLAVSPSDRRPQFEPSLHRVRFANGAQVQLF